MKKVKFCIKKDTLLCKYFDERQSSYKIYIINQKRDIEVKLKKYYSDFGNINDLAYVAIDKDTKKGVGAIWF